MSEYEITIFNLLAYQNNASNQVYLRFGDTEIFSDGKSIWFSNESGYYVAEYNDSLKEVFELSETFEYKREADIELPDERTKVNRDFLLEYFKIPIIKVIIAQSFAMLCTKRRIAYIQLKEKNY